MKPIYNFFNIDKNSIWKDPKGDLIRVYDVYWFNNFIFEPSVVFYYINKLHDIDEHTYMIKLNRWDFSKCMEMFCDV